MATKISGVLGRVEAAIKAAFQPGVILKTPTGRGQFTVARYTTENLVMLLGEQQASTHLPLRTLEELPDLPRARGSVRIGSFHSMDSIPGALDAHLKHCLARATTCRLAVILKQAGVVGIDRDRPAKVGHAPHWSSAPRGTSS